MQRAQQLTRRIRITLVFFIVCLILSGLTAFPLVTEMDFIGRLMGIDPSTPPDQYDGLKHWVAYVGQGLRQTSERYPFIAYGTDWLAFGHLVIAVAFIGPWRDPVRNIWVLQFGMIACVGVIPLAMIAGEVRQIPMYWRLIDCGFGVFGFIPLYLCHRDIKALEVEQNGSIHSAENA
jgi:hypothetical protein